MPMKTYQGTTVTVPTGTTFTQALFMQLGGEVSDLVIDLINSGAANALTGFRLIRGAYIGSIAAGDGRVWLSGTDFNTATVELVDAVGSAGSPPNLHQTPASGGWGQLKLEHLKGVAEIALEVQCNTSGGTKVKANAGGV